MQKVKDLLPYISAMFLAFNLYSCTPSANSKNVSDPVQAGEKSCGCAGATSAAAPVADAGACPCDPEAPVCNC